MLNDLIINLTLLIGLSGLYGLLGRFRKREFLYKALTGLLFGLITIVGMSFPFNFSEGIIFDGRSIILTLAGLFGGGTVTLIAGIIAAAYRAYLGGAGVWAGLATIIVCSLIGLYARRKYNNHPENISVSMLWIVGVVTHVGMLMCQMLLPWFEALKIISEIWLPIMIFFPVATMLIGLILKNDAGQLQAQFDLHSFFENDLSGNYLSTPGGKILNCNTAFAKMLGYTSKEEIFNIPAEEFYPESESREGFLELLVKNKHFLNYEFDMVKRDGTIINCIENVIGVFDKKGKLIQIQGHIFDITEQKHAEKEKEEAYKALKESEDRFRKFFENLGDAVLVAELGGENKGKILEVNPAAEKQTGYTREELLQLNVLKDLIVNENSEDGVEEREELLKNDQIVKVTDERKRKDGSKYWSESILTTIFYKGRKAVLSINHDITERIQIEKALRESESKYRLLIDQANSGIYLLYKNKFEIVNKKFTEMFGYTIEDTNAPGFDFRQLIAPNSMTVIKEREEKTAKGEEVPNQYEFTAITKSGEKIECEVNVAYVDYKDGIATQGIIRDITQRKQMTRELITAKEEAEIANKLKSEFLAQMSHEIRTPLNALMNYVSLLREEINPKDAAEFDDIFEGISNSGERIIRTIDLILNASELQAGVYKLINKEIDLYEDIILPVQQGLRRYANSKDLELRIKRETRNTMVVGDEYSIYQTVINLADNAIKYTLKGHVELSVKRNESDNLQIEVEDTGMGMSQKYINHMFDPFSQEETGYSRRFEGTGLGLSLVKKYCDLNGIEISAASEKDKGTKFTLTFVNN